MDLKVYETTINTIARRYARNPDDLEDYKQLGRITVWEVLEKKPDADTNYIAVAIKNGLLSYFKHERAQKRMPSGGLVSLSSPIKEGKQNTIEEFIGREDQAYAPQIEVVKGMIEILREKYGRFYIKKIQGSENGPRGLVRRIMRSVIEEVHGFSKEKAAQKVDYQFFVDNGLGPLLWVFYDNSPFHAVADAFKGELLPWDFRRKPQGFWKGRKGYERSLEAVGWFVNQKGLKSLKDCRHIKLEDFEKTGLAGMIQRHFNSSPYLALKTRFPELHPWQTKGTPAGFFDDKNNQIDAVLNFLLNKGIPSILELNPEETYETGIRTIVTKNSMGDEGLRGLLKRFDGSTYRIYSTLFPNQILPWTLLGSKEPWEENPKKTAAESIRWLFDDYLKISLGDIPEYATCKLFWRVGFSGILTNRQVGFNSSPYTAVDSAYPGIFSKEDFSRSRTVSDLQTRKLKKAWKKKGQSQ